MGSPALNMNPSGVYGAGNFNTGPVGTTPGTSAAGPGNMNFGNATNPHPTMPGSSSFAASSPAATAPASTPIGGSGQTPFGPGMTSPGQSLGSLQNIYGTGMGNLIWQYLQSNGGYNSALTRQAVDAQTNAMGTQIQTGANNLTSMLADMGISSGSSVLPQALAGYEASAAQSEGSITAQEYYNMWNASQNRQAQMLGMTAQDAASYVANQPTWMDYLNMSLGLAGTAAGIYGALKL